MRAYRWALRVIAVALLFTTAGSVRAADHVEVTSASVQFDLRSQHEARAALEVDLRVGPSGMTRFELFDLGPDARLDPYAPPQFVGVDGGVSLPSVRTLPNGAVALEFPDRRSALKPGDYSLRCWWRLPLTAAGSALLRMPSWPNRVSNARIVVLAPRAAQPDTLGRYDQWSRRELDADSSELTFTRVELPRTESFAVTLALPVPEHHRRASKVDPPDARRLLGVGLGLALGLCWLAKRRACQLRARDAFSELIVPGCSMFAVGAFDVWPLMAAVVGVSASLIGSRACRTAPLPPEPAEPGAVSRALRGPHDAAAWFEITHPGGASAALLAFALLAYAEPFAPAAVSCSAWLLAPIFLSVRGLSPWGRAHAV